MKFKVDDKVLVISGKNKGKTGQILRFNKDRSRAVVTGINIVKRHVKAASHRAGGIIPQEAPLSVSNLMLICPNCEKKTRIGYKFTEKGQKERVCKKCKQAIIFIKETKKK